MIEVKPLTEFDSISLRELISGYTSPATYRVTKSEDENHTVISMTLKNLDTPYVKHWNVTDDEIDHYRKLIKEGLSVGAYVDGELVGVAIVKKKTWNRTLVIWEFHIHPDYQNQGIGTKMMEQIADIGRKATCRVIECETQNTNVPAIRFYQKVGFEVGAIDPSYYTNSDTTDFEVAVFMKRYIE
jgi:ribosomal protein S18 acetylase RimI-like enzyme